MKAGEVGMAVRAFSVAWMGALLVIAGGARSVAAGDEPRAEAFGGYSYGRSADESLHGWNASLCYNLNRWLGLEAELAGHMGSLGMGTDLDRLSFMGGPRLVWRQGKLTPFLHALVGGVRTSTGVTVQNVSIAARDTNLGGAAGGGLDVALGQRWGVRLQGDYLVVRTGGETAGDPRAAVGISYRLGRRGATQTVRR